jgi:hypothetical protein
LTIFHGIYHCNILIFNERFFVVPPVLLGFVNKVGDLCGMFLKVVNKGSRIKGNVVMHFRMVEAYRQGDTVRHQNIYHLGALPELTRPEDIKALGRRIDLLVKEKISGQKTLFTSENPEVERLAQYYSDQIIVKNKIDYDKSKNYELIDTDSLSHSDVREVGAEWLMHQALDQLKIKEFLENAGFSETNIQLAYTHIISRAVCPNSEYATARWIRDNSAVCELTGYPVEKLTKDKLYNCSHQLYAINDKLENHLSKKTNELFDIQDKIIIYDLTNTYFEGKFTSSKIAKFGRSKEKRSDAKLIVLALVVNEYGFVKYSKICEGNKSDSKSLEDILTELTSATSYLERRPIVVLDAGIATDANLDLLKSKHYNYMCVSRKGLSKYHIDETRNPIIVKDNKGQSISLQNVRIENSSDQYLLVSSDAKTEKEKSMNDQFKQRFETGLQQIKDSLTKKSGIKTIEKVSERIGRIKQKYPSISKYYNIEILKNESGDKVIELKWLLIKKSANEGNYLLRTNLDTKNEKVQWEIYNVIREIEATFRVLKTDLDLRPIYHKTDAAAIAHLHLGIIAYSVVNTIRYQLKKEGITSGWREIVRIMNTQKLVTSRMEGPEGKIIQIRKCSEPTKQVSNIYKALNYKIKPFKQKKFVVPPQPPNMINPHYLLKISSP